MHSPRTFALLSSVLPLLHLHPFLSPRLCCLSTFAASAPLLLFLRPFRPHLICAPYALSLRAGMRAPPLRPSLLSASSPSLPTLSFPLCVLFHARRHLVSCWIISVSAMWHVAFSISCSPSFSSFLRVCRFSSCAQQLLVAQQELFASPVCKPFPATDRSWQWIARFACTYAWLLACSSVCVFRLALSTPSYSFHLF